MSWKMLRRTLVIALIALIVSACCSSREATREVSSLRIQDSRDSVKVEKVVVAVHDTIMETTTIVVDRNETGDTLKLSTVTERDRVRDRAQVKDQHERIVMKTDTVFVATRDSSYITNTDLTNRTNERSGFVYGVKWLVALVAAVIVLVIVLKFSFLGKRFV
jgi:hypothetical protein